MPYMIAALLGLVGAVLFGIQLYRIVVGYRLATGTRWQRFLAAYSNSLTIFVSRVLAFSSAFVAWFINFAPQLAPEGPLHDAVIAVLDPRYVPWYALGVALLIEACRRRRGSVDPILPPPQSAAPAV